MEALIELLKERGYKVTPQRRAVIEALRECGRFATVQQILSRVKRILPDVSLDTVYRNLELLTELNAVTEINTRNAEGKVYEISSIGHHHHRVCLRCGKTECVDYCPVSDDAIDVSQAERDGFKITSHSLEFYGYCRECRMKE